MLLAFSLEIGFKVLTPTVAGAAFLAAGTVVVFGFMACLTNYRLPVLSVDASESESTRIVRWRRWALWAWPLLLIILTFLRRHFLTSRLDASNL